MKSAIIIDPTLPTGLLANAVACIASGIFSGQEELVGQEIKGSDVTYIPITKIPILVLKPNGKSILELCQEAQKLGLKYMAFTNEAQSTTSYETYTKAVEGKSIESVTLLGLGIVGEDKIVNSLVGNLPMLR